MGGYSFLLFLVPVMWYIFPCNLIFGAMVFYPFGVMSRALLSPPGDDEKRERRLDNLSGILGMALGTAIFAASAALSSSLLSSISEVDSEVTRYVVATLGVLAAVIPGYMATTGIEYLILKSKLRELAPRGLAGSVLKVNLYSYSTGLLMLAVIRLLLRITGIWPTGYLPNLGF